MSDLILKEEAVYILPQEGGMRVPGLVIATESLIDSKGMEEPLQQVRNVAHLPGIVSYSIAMPDIHWGYGFPIGGVAAMEAESGVISPGGVGYDINCGVRLALIPIAFKEMSAVVKKELIDTIYRNVPSGVGHGHKEKELSSHDYRGVLTQGARWSIERDMGFLEDLDHMESSGCIAEADSDCVSPEAKQRGANQLGSIGSGNHFVEIGEIERLFLPDIAKIWGVDRGMTYALIHSGSRGLGHQVCQDHLNTFIKEGYAEGLPDRQLVAAPLKSGLGQHYLKAMGAAANFAFNNRQQILFHVRRAVKEVLNIEPGAVKLLYDVCHNIAKMERHPVGNTIKSLCVHRKGATRAFGPHHPELSPLFQKTGQPVLVPGDMGRASHLLVGCGNPLTFCSCCHGAGRALSRHQALKNWQGRDPSAYMEKQGISVRASSKRTISEEMPEAYKDVDEVVLAVEQAKLARRVARLKPAMVLKG